MSDTRITIRISSDLKERLENEAKSNIRTLSQEILYRLKRSLEDEVEEDNQGKIFP